MLNKGMIWGWIFTVVWTGICLAYVIFMFGLTKFISLLPNEMGDFFAGYAAPLAFFWLVLGYFQQGKELGLQRKELKLQRQELELQRRETERLANETQRQAEAVESNELHARKDTFFRTLYFVTDEQVSYAQLILEQMVGGDQVRRYKETIQHGDKSSAFFLAARHIFPNATDDFLMKCKKNSWLGVIVSNYIRNFENILKEVGQCDPDNSIRKQIEYSNMGTLYAGMCLITNNRISFQMRSEPKSAEDILS